MLIVSGEVVEIPGNTLDTKEVNEHQHL